MSEEIRRREIAALIARSLLRAHRQNEPRTIQKFQVANPEKKESQTTSASTDRCNGGER